MVKTKDAVGTIQRQVDSIVTHMLDLGKKSQQIGGILEIINELAEQTNILAINATIEAAGAGEMGKRFGVVADEIRKLADRVGGSTKEIRGLVDDIRAAVNTTVMATEGGSKAVDPGTRQFGEVASSFKQIAGLVATTTDAAKEIELSTKQQATAVEQVNVAVVNVSQAAREIGGELQPDAADVVAAHDTLEGPGAAHPAAGGMPRPWRRDPYKYFRVEARELVEGLEPRRARAGEGHRGRRAYRRHVAVRAHAQGSLSGGPSSAHRRARARDRGSR